MRSEADLFSHLVWVVGLVTVRVLSCLNSSEACVSAICVAIRTVCAIRSVRSIGAIADWSLWVTGWTHDCVVYDFSLYVDEV